MKKKLSVLLGFILCAGMLTSCASKEANANAEKVAEAIKESNLDGDITVTSCSEIYSYSDGKDERDEQEPTFLFEIELEEYCYIEIEEDDGDEQVYVLPVDGKYKGSVYTYDDMLNSTVSRLIDMGDYEEYSESSIKELIKGLYPDEYTVTQSENVSVKKINKILSE